MLTGTRGAGKSTIANALVASGGYGLVGAVTTRSPRADDDGVYTYISEEDMSLLRERGELLISATYGIHSYGITRHAALAIAAAGGTPIVVITPASAVEFLASRDGKNWVAVFLDSPDELLDARLEADGRPVIGADVTQRQTDRGAIDKGLRVVVNDKHLAMAVNAVEAVVNEGRR